MLLTQPLQGWEYGTLRSLEAEIVRQTGAASVPVLVSGSSYTLHRRFGHGTRYGRLRRLVPRRAFTLPEDLDVLWLVLMGPENYPVDLLRGWQNRAKTSIVYLFDTLPSQIPLIGRLFSGKEWDVLVTSFNDAVPLLARATNRHWHHVDQAVSRSLFAPAPSCERLIHFSAYGRRHPKVHEATIAFCQQNGLYYDFSTHPPGVPQTDPSLLMGHYSWHLCHSLFTFSWPVEMTNRHRASGLSPVTCRWFEAAAAGTTILGQAPSNPKFRALFGDDCVIPINTIGTVESIVSQLETIWQMRSKLHARAAARREELGHNLDWSDRVAKMLKLVEGHDAMSGPANHLL